jgi:polar amino acid transport system substrate-binding protein
MLTPRFARVAAGLLGWLVLWCLPAVAAERVSLVSTDYPPYFATSLPEQGTLSAIARAAFEAAGYEVTLTFRPWARLMAEVEGGRYDGVVAVWYKAERESFLAYTDPLVDTHIGFYGRRDATIDVRNLGKLAPYTIGTVRGYANPPAFDAAKLTTDEAVDDVTNLRKLAAGRLDLVLIDKALADYLVRQNMPASTATIGWLEPPVQTMPLYVGIAKKRPGYEQRLAAFNKGLAEIRRNGELDRILKRLPLVYY